MPDNRENVKLRVAMNQFIGFYYNQLYIALFFYIKHYLVTIHYLRKLYTDI